MERPDLNLSRIGELCGYRSPSYFGKVFREMTGLTPQNFRTVRQDRRRFTKVSFHYIMKTSRDGDTEVVEG